MVLDALRQEPREHGIQVTVVCPPEVATPMVEQESKTILKQTRLLKDLCGTLSTDQVVRETTRGLVQKRHVIIPGFRARMTHRLYRWFPGMVTRVLDLILEKRF